MRCRCFRRVELLFTFNVDVDIWGLFGSRPRTSFGACFFVQIVPLPVEAVVAFAKDHPEIGEEASALLREVGAQQAG